LPEMEYLKRVEFTKLLGVTLKEIEIEEKKGVRYRRGRMKVDMDDKSRPANQAFHRKTDSPAKQTWGTGG